MYVNFCMRDSCLGKCHFTGLLVKIWDPKRDGGFASAQRLLLILASSQLLCHNHWVASAFPSHGGKDAEGWCFGSYGFIPVCRWSTARVQTELRLNWSLVHPFDCSPSDSFYREYHHWKEKATLKLHDQQVQLVPMPLWQGRKKPAPG